MLEECPGRPHEASLIKMPGSLKVVNPRALAMTGLRGNGNLIHEKRNLGHMSIIVAQDRLKCLLRHSRIGAPVMQKLWYIEYSFWEGDELARYRRYAGHNLSRRSRSYSHGIMFTIIDLEEQGPDTKTQCRPIQAQTSMSNSEKPAPLEAGGVLHLGWCVDMKASLEYLRPFN